MKKLMFVAALAAAMTGLADVTSANVVGYHTLTIYPGNNIFSVNFDNMSDADGYTLDELFPILANPGITKNMTATSADTIKTWDPNKGATGGYSDTYYALYVAANPGWQYNNKWVKALSTPSTLKIKSGASFWYYHNAPAGSDPLVFQVAGQVTVHQAGANIVIAPGNNMIASPFSCDWDFNTLGAEFWKARADAGEAVAGMTNTSADYFKVWDSVNSKYGDTYYLLNVAANPGWAYNYKWVKALSTVAPTGFIKLGGGGFYYCKGTGFTLNVADPYDL